MKVLTTNAVDVARWVSEPLVIQHTGGVGIGLQEDGQLIAGVYFEQYYGKSIALHLRVTRTVTRAFVSALFHYPFVYCNVNKLIAVIDSDNTQTVRLAKHAGFTQEARIQDAGLIGDLLIFTMTREQCRYIRGKYAFIIPAAAA